MATRTATLTMVMPELPVEEEGGVAPVVNGGDLSIQVPPRPSQPTGGTDDDHHVH